jgi:hypothetical protein
MEHRDSYYQLSSTIEPDDGLPALNIIDQTQNDEARVTPSYLVDEWLPWVHIAIGNLKTFLLGTLHEVSGKSQ